MPETQLNPLPAYAFRFYINNRPLNVSRVKPSEVDGRGRLEVAAPVLVFNGGGFGSCLDEYAGTVGHTLDLHILNKDGEVLSQQTWEVMDAGDYSQGCWDNLCTTMNATLVFEQRKADDAS